MKYGVDVASLRLDDLDKRLLVDVKERLVCGEDVNVLDIGCGAGGLSVALAKVGAKVTALDITDYKNEIDETIKRNEPLLGDIIFKQVDLKYWQKQVDNKFSIAVLQRVLHYLPYTTAKEVLDILRERTDTLYLSVTGNTTAIAKHYPMLEKSIEERWGILDEVGQELFSISVPLCIYSKEELFTLLNEAGWEIIWSRVSDFGNIKIVATVR